jgi:hypothetical protein
MKLVPLVHVLLFFRTCPLFSFLYEDDLRKSPKFNLEIVFDKIAIL